MDDNQDYGCSDYTPLKVDYFEILIRMHLALAGAVFKRNPWLCQTYHYFDITAGPGLHPENSAPQSPLVFTRAAAQKYFVWRASFIEKHSLSAASLQQSLGTITNTAVLCADHHDVLSDLLAAQLPIPKDKYLGLVYYDPVPKKYMFDSLKFLAELSERPQLKRIDFLLSLSATGIKRLKHLTSLTLQEVMSRFAKKHWLVREPFGQRQWTFLLGTNWAKFPDYKRICFHRTDSKAGRDILERLNYSDKDRPAHQGDLFSEVS